MKSFYSMVMAAVVLGMPLLASAQCMRWSVCAGLPALEAGGRVNPGVAGPFTGVSGGVLLIAGGANFPAGKPWEGGKKAYTDEIYVVRQGADGGFSCRLLSGFRLPEKIAYGASVTTGAGIVCIGGETGSGFSNQVFLLSWDEGVKKPRVGMLPDLPKGLASACAGAIGTKVYVIGGEDARQPLADVFLLDMRDPSAGWEKLAPLPEALSHAVAVTGSDGLDSSIYVIGGRSKTDSGISVLHSTVFRFDASAKAWERMTDIHDGRRKIHLSAASAVAHGSDILVIGGDRGDIFHRIEVYNARIASAANDSVAAVNTQKKLKLVLNHPGFSRVILAYNVRSNRWRKIGTLPGDSPVTTTAVCWDRGVFLPCGEVRPGVRSAVIWRGVFCDK